MPKLTALARLRSGDGVDVVVVFESGDHVLVIGDMRQHAQLDLRIVRVDQYPALTGTEKLAHFPAELGADGNVLQIRLGGTDPAGARLGLVEAGMDPAVLADDLEQALAIGGVQLGKRTVIEHHLDDRMVVTQAFEHLGVGAVAALGFLLRRKVQVIKEHLAELLGRVDVELLTGVEVDRAFQLLDLRGKHHAVVGDALSVHGKAEVFHLGKDACQRDLDLRQQLFLTVRLYLIEQLAAELVVYAERQQVFIGIVLRAGQGDLVHGAEVFVAVILFGRLQQIRRQLHVKGDVVHLEAVSVSIGKERLAAAGIEPDFRVLQQSIKGVFVGTDRNHAVLHDGKVL